MTTPLTNLPVFLASHARTVLVEVVQVKGSAPREAGAWMLVSEDRIFGTIGGGQLEFRAIGKARGMLADNHEKGEIDLALGADTGQCCGGRVTLSFTALDETGREQIVQRAQREAAARPQVMLFGGGHVGQALAAAFSLLPVHVSVVETRVEALEGLADGVTRRLVALPETEVRDAPAGSAFVILTHDHALDFLIAGEALRRRDAAYIGMIGSASKRATFKNWFLREGGDEKALSRLVLPIGGTAVQDKRPAVIAAMTVAEVMTAFAADG